MTIGQRIKQLRIESKLTQKELSQKLNLTPKMVSFYENNERTPPADILVKLATIFHVSTDFLLNISDKNSSEEKNNINNIGKQIKYLRLNSNMTQEKFAEIFGLTKSTISLYESGKSTPNDQLKSEICSFFNISMDTLFGRTNELILDSNINLGERLKNLRINYNLTQKELSSKLHISASTIGMYEQNRRFPDPKTIINIANYFQVSIDYLFGSSTMCINETVLSEQEQYLLNTFNALTRNQKYIILGKISEMLENDNLDK